MHSQGSDVASEAEPEEAVSSLIPVHGGLMGLMDRLGGGGRAVCVCVIE